jgi:hypothetical protein
MDCATMQAAFPEKWRGAFSEFNAYPAPKRSSMTSTNRSISSAMDLPYTECHARISRSRRFMPDPANPRRPKRDSYKPRPETLALLKVSGNPINGLGEAAPRRPSPFFWHPPDQHPYVELQNLARQNSRKCPGSAPAFIAAYTHPELIPVAGVRNQAPPHNSRPRQRPLRSPTRRARLASHRWTHCMSLRVTPSTTHG